MGLAFKSIPPRVRKTITGCCRNAQYFREDYGLHRENPNKSYLNGQIFI